MIKMSTRNLEIDYLLAIVLLVLAFAAGDAVSLQTHRSTPSDSDYRSEILAGYQVQDRKEYHRQKPRGFHLE